MFVSAILKDVPDEDKIEQMLSSSKPLQRLVQQHNRIAFVNENINVVTKEFTGTQLKDELRKHQPELLIGLLHEYISLIKIIVSVDDPDGDHKHDMQIKISKDSKHKNKIEIIENGDSSDELKSADKRSLKIFGIKFIISIFSVCILAVVGSIIYISINNNEQIDTEIATSLFKTTFEIVKFIISPSK